MTIIINFSTYHNYTLHQHIKLQIIFLHVAIDSLASLRFLLFLLVLLHVSAPRLGHFPLGGPITIRTLKYTIVAQ